MTNEEKQSLFVDLCSRLPYGVKAKVYGHNNPLQILVVSKLYKSTWAWNKGTYVASFWNDTKAIEQVKPYLRPISSLTDEECNRLFKILDINEKDGDWLKINDTNIIRLFTENGKDFYEIAEAMDYLYSIHVDFRNLIEKGLALEAKEGMYKTE